MTTEQQISEFKQIYHKKQRKEDHRPTSSK